jgi:hypothetical protein
MLKGSSPPPRIPHVKLYAAVRRLQSRRSSNHISRHPASKYARSKVLLLREPRNMAKECGCCRTFDHDTGTSPSRTRTLAALLVLPIHPWGTTRHEQSLIHHHIPTRSYGFLPTASTNSINTFLPSSHSSRTTRLKATFTSALLTSCVSKNGRIIASLAGFFPSKIKSAHVSTPCSGNGARRTTLLISTSPAVCIPAATWPGVVQALESGAKFGGEKDGSWIRHTRSQIR